MKRISQEKRFNILDSPASMSSGLTRGPEDDGIAKSIFLGDKWRVSGDNDQWQR